MSQKVDLRTLSYQKLQIFPDSDTTALHFSGGIRAYYIEEDAFVLDPVYHLENACSARMFTRSMLDGIVKQCKIRYIGQSDFSIRDGLSYSSFRPPQSRLYDQDIDARQAWRRIELNEAETRIPSDINLEWVGTRKDDAGAVEFLSRHIQLSLRSAFNSMYSISEFYNEQLRHGIMSGGNTKSAFSTTSEHDLSANVHSFFLHLASARDFLCSLAAYQLRVVSNDKISENSCDSCARLIEKLRSEHVRSSMIATYIVESKYIQPHATKQRQYELSGWFREINEMRNRLVHSAPLGSRYSERHGGLDLLDENLGLLSYRRMIDLSSRRSQAVGDPKQIDVLEFIRQHAIKAQRCFTGAALASGYNMKIKTLTDDDFIDLDKINISGE